MDEEGTVWISGTALHIIVGVMEDWEWISVIKTSRMNLPV
jgi:hypothetical protein